MNDHSNNEVNTLTLRVEDGTHRDFIVQCMISHNSKQYAALSKDYKPEEYEPLCLHELGTDLIFDPITDLAEKTEIIEIFNNHLQGGSK
jgi:hypothetical protein